MKTLKVEMLVLGLVSTNTYVVYNENTREAFIVDPSADAPRILFFNMRIIYFEVIFIFFKFRYDFK